MATISDGALLRAEIQVDQWDRVERGRGPEWDDLRERASTLIDVLREIVASAKKEGGSS